VVLDLDTSALVKRYVNEPGSDVVREVTVGADLHTSHITIVEFVAAVCRHGRTGSLSNVQVAAALRLFRGETDDLYDLVNVTRAVVDLAASLAERHVLRGYDAVQVASALSLARAVAPERVTLLSADRRMCEIARVEGMDVIDPTDEPA